MSALALARLFSGAPWTSTDSLGWIIPELGRTQYLSLGQGNHRVRRGGRCSLLGSSSLDLFIVISMRNVSCPSEAGFLP
jgi:hypothetical protein